MKLDKTDALAQLARKNTDFSKLFAYGSLSVEIYAPKGEDLQQPHEQDEVYIVLSGKGSFVLEGQRMTFAPGDLIFVPAGAPHHFVDFTPDFATWVVFYGPKGGENA